MKKGLICLVAILAAFVFTTSTYAADTTTVIAGTDPRGVGVAVDANNAPYVAGKTATTSAGVFSTAKASFDGTASSRIDNVISSVDGQNFRLTAVALGAKEDSAIVAAVTTADTNFTIHFEDTSGNFRVHQQIRPRPGSHSTTVTDSINILSIAAGATDSYLLVVISVNPTVAASSTGGNQDSGLIAYLFRVTPGGISEPVDTEYLSGTNRTPLAVDLQVEPSKTEGTDPTKDTFACFYILANVIGDSTTVAGPDTGIWLFKTYATDRLNTGLLATAAVKVDSGFRNDAALQVEKVNSSDTRDRVTILLASQGERSQSGGAPEDTYILIEVSVDSYAGLGNGIGPNTNITGAEGVATVVHAFDTGIESILSSAPQSIAFRRSGSSINILAILANGNLYSINGSLNLVPRAPFGLSIDQSLSLSFDTVGRNTGYTANSIVAGQDNEEMAQADKDGTLHVAGINDNTDHIWYFTFGGAASGKKDSGVCLMDRLFGKTSIRAAFPALKSFRDTLLGTNLGRKIVSLYYSF